MQTVDTAEQKFISEPRLIFVIVRVSIRGMLSCMRSGEEERVDGRQIHRLGPSGDYEV